jgi:hypothetical protein
MSNKQRKAPPKGHLGRGWLEASRAKQVDQFACNERSRSCHKQNSCRFVFVTLDRKKCPWTAGADVEQAAMKSPRLAHGVKGCLSIMPRHQQDDEAAEEGATTGGAKT